MDKNTELFLSALDMLDEKLIESALEVIEEPKRTEIISSDELIICEKQSNKANHISLIALSAACIAVIVAVSTLVMLLTSDKVSVTDSYSSFVSELFSSSEIITSSDENSFENIDVKEKIKLLTYYVPDGNEPFYDIFRELYGTPELIPDGYEAYENDIFAIKKVSINETFKELSVMINSDSSPDIMPATSFQHYEAEYYAKYGYKDDGSPVFSEINDVIDINDPLWDNVRYLNECSIVGGRQYLAVTGISVDEMRFLWYRKSNIEKYDLPDPYELYLNGKWDTAAFSQLAESYSSHNPENAFLSSEDFDLAPNFVLATGKSFVEISNGKYITNFNDKSVIDSMGFLDKLISNYSIDIRDGSTLFGFINANPLFFITMTDQLNAGMKNINSDNDIAFVPFPKKDKTSEYSYQVFTNGYYLCKGGNPDYFRAVVTAQLIAENSGKANEYLLKQKKQNGWNEELLEKLEHVIDETKKKPVIDLYYSLVSIAHREERNSSDIPKMMYPVIYPVTGKMSYTEAVESYAPYVEKALEKLNY